MSVIIKPLISEKRTADAEKFNRYGFVVVRTATKPQIKKEVEELYGVKVIRVNTIIQRGKDNSRYTKDGLIEGSKPTIKKATVFVRPEDKIDFYSNI